MQITEKPKVITVANQKGGAGKTTTALCFAGGLASMNKKVLIVDTDPQCNTTSFYGAVTENENTLYDFYKDECSFREMIQHTKLGDVVPCDKVLAGTEATFTTGPSVFKNFNRLKKGIEEINGEYEYVIIDTPPNLGFYMSSALIAADRVLIPITAERFAVEGLGQILETIKEAKETNTNLQIAGVLLTKYSKKQKLDKSTLATLPEASKALGFPIFKKPIRICQDIVNAQAEGVLIFEKYPKSNAAVDYMAAIKQLIKEW